MPSLGFKIHEENKKDDQPANWTRINLGIFKIFNIFQISHLKICSAGIGMGNGWMSPLDQGKYASYLFFHGLLDKAQYQQLDEIGELLTLFI